MWRDGHLGRRDRRAAKRGNIFRREAKAKKLRIIDSTELRADALLPRVVIRPNEPPHQTGSCALSRAYRNALLQMIGRFEMPLGEGTSSARGFETLVGASLRPKNVAEQSDVAQQPGNCDYRIKTEADVSRKERNQ